VWSDSWPVKMGLTPAPETSSGNSPRTPSKNPKTKNQYSFHDKSLKSKTMSLFRRTMRQMPSWQTNQPTNFTYQGTLEELTFPQMVNKFEEFYSARKLLWHMPKNLCHNHVNRRSDVTGKGCCTVTIQYRAKPSTNLYIYMLIYIIFRQTLWEFSFFPVRKHKNSA
jgi:hypothetical protein